MTEPRCCPTPRAGGLELGKMNSAHGKLPCWCGSPTTSSSSALSPTISRPELLPWPLPGCPYSPRFLFICREWVNGLFLFFLILYLLPNFEGRVVGSQASWEGSERKMFPSTLSRAWPGVFWSPGMCDRILELMPRSQCLCSYLEATATGVFKCFPGRHREDCGQGLPDP